jgi:hypothetical protein
MNKVFISGMDFWGEHELLSRLQNLYALCTRITLGAKSTMYKLKADTPETILNSKLKVLSN